jgi:hypothetical protein
MPHLHLAITAHGYGHLAQVAPVVTELRRRIPSLRVTLQGDVDSDFAAARLPAGFQQIEESADVALPMTGPLHAKWQAGLALFQRFDAGYEARLAAQETIFHRDPPDLLLADVPWLPLDAARRLDIPGVGLCSLNWHDILVGGPIGGQVPAAMAARMRAAYSNAELFIRPRPSMPMTWLPNGRDVGPIASQGRRDPAGLRRRLGIADDVQVVLMLFGGAGSLALPAGWEPPDDMLLLTPIPAAAEGRDRIQLIPISTLPDTLASCDAVLTKPGYGTFAEAGCAGIPVLYVPRDDWPEEPYLVDWLADRVPIAPLPAADLAAGAIEQPLRGLIARSPAEPFAPAGVEETANLLQPFLERGGH